MPAKAKDPEVEIRKAVVQYEKLLRVALLNRSRESSREPSQKMVREIVREIFPKRRNFTLGYKRRAYMEIGMRPAIMQEFRRMLRENEWEADEVIEVMIRRALRENVNLVFDIIKLRTDLKKGRRKK